MGALAKIIVFFFSFKLPLHLLRRKAVADNGIGLGEVALCVGLCVGKPFCQTCVTGWLG